MPFPYSYKKTIDISKNNFNLNYIILKINTLPENYKFNEIKIDENEISLKSKNSLVYFDYQLKINIDAENEELCIEIEIINLFKISLLILIVIPFISNFSISNFFIFSTIVFAIFYGANLLYINNFINKFIDFLIKDIAIDKAVEEQLSEKQIEWMSDPYKCSACGSRIEDYFAFCDDCGIKIDRKPKKSPFNFTNYNNWTIKYDFKKSD